MKYDVEAFSFLQEREFAPGWGSVSQAELEDTISSLISEGITNEDAPEVFETVESYLALLDQLKPGAIVEFSNADILTVHADENGLLDVVLGPAIFKGENDTITLKVGSNLISVKLSGTTAKCGTLEGDIEVIEEKPDNKPSYLVVSLDHYQESTETSIQIPVILENAEEVEKAKFKAALKKGNIAGFLKPIPQGGNWISMNDLDEGKEYRLIGIEERDPHAEYGRSWLMTLEGVGDVISKGKRFQRALIQKAGIYKKLLSMGKPVTLLISSKKDLGDGKTQVQAGFFAREPRKDRLAAGTTPKAIPQAKQPVLTSAASVESQSLDEIPF